MTRVGIEVWGPHAERFCERHYSGRVAAVFTRSLHLQVDGDFLCLGDEGIGRGPLNAIVAADGWTRLAPAVPAPGAAVLLDRHSIRIGAVAVDTAEAAAWRPAPWPRAVDPVRLADSLQHSMRLGSERAPADGLARIVLAPEPGASSALARIAHPRIARLRAWLDTCRSPPLRTRPPVDLLGLGPGLTPSGDDLLCGALVALHAVGWTAVADSLARAISMAAQTATSPLSGAFLRAATRGFGSEALHATILALLAGRTALAPHLEALDRIGHTSGWDALAGSVLVLQAFRTTAVQRTGVASPELSL